MSRRVWLVRHASTDWTGQRWCGTTDLPLNERGRAEAERLATALAVRVSTGTELVSSPLRRAIETADRVAPAIGSAAAIDGRLREVDFGDLEGLDWIELETRDPAVARAIATGVTTIDWPGGDTAGEVGARAAALWRDVAYRADDVVLVSHGAFLRAVIDAAVGDTGVPPEIRPASVIELGCRGGELTVRP
jgi:broad specificity phosphatase PhoE